MACWSPDGLAMTSVTLPCLAVSVLWLKAIFVLLALRFTVVAADTMLATASTATTAATPTTAAIRSLRAALGMGLLGRGLRREQGRAFRAFLPRRVRRRT